MYVRLCTRECREIARRVRPRADRTRHVPGNGTQLVYVQPGHMLFIVCPGYLHYFTIVCPDYWAHSLPGWSTRAPGQEASCPGASHAAI